MIQFFSTLSGKKEFFEPINPLEVGLYTCGPTVYDYAHIGNFRAFIFEDLLRRFLEFSKYKVRHVMNLTDVDDKTIAGAVREGKPLDDYTARYIQAFNEDLRVLNCLPPHEQPRATEHIYHDGGIVDLIEKLWDKGAVYERDGSVYFRVAAFPGYGRLSKKKLDMNIAGASERVDADEYEKEEVTDFVLWKKAKEGEPYWDSRWGRGRPGWHIECSAMSMKYLGPSFDIHAGGEDLIFPHHENEIAQSEAASGAHPFVKYWLHCKFLLVDGEKMSKSKGNFYTLRDLLDKGYDPMAIRYALLAVHYRHALNFTLEGLKEAEDAIRKFDDCYWECLTVKERIHEGGAWRARQMDVHDDILAPGLEGWIGCMTKALGDDLNISSALSFFVTGVGEINRYLAHKIFGDKNIAAAIHFFKEADRLFGFDIASADAIPQAVEKCMREREEIRKRIKETGDKSLWAVSDELRQKIHATGWLVKDGKPGEPSTVKMKRRVWDR